MKRIVNRRRFVDLLQSIKRHLARTEITATRFGQEAVNDGRLVHDMRRGRRLRPETEARVRAYMARTGA